MKLEKRNAYFCNTQKAINFCINSFSLLKEKKVGCGAIFLNDDLLNDMFVLIVVDEKDYIKSDFLEMLKGLDSLVYKNSDDLFHVHYKILPYYTQINEDMIVADGYTILYDGKKVKVHRSRKS